MSLQIAVRERKPFFFELALTGRLDTGTYMQLEQQLDSLMAVSAKSLVFDLAALDYISSLGLRVVFKAMKDVAAAKGLFMISRMQPQVQRVFEIANALPDDSIFQSVEEADAYYAAIQEKVKSAE
jgi:anti-anti-sigma factor